MPDGQWTMIPLERIHPSPLNPRKTFGEADLAELAASLKAKGVLVPLLVRPAGKWFVEEVGPIVHVCCPRAAGFGHNRHQTLTGKEGLARAKAIVVEKNAAAGCELVDGERRWRAAKLAALAQLPCIVRPMSDVEALECMVISCVQREDVPPLEKAEGYHQLMTLGRATVEELAAKVGQSVATVREYLHLRRLPESLRAAVAAGTVGATTAALVARVPSDQLREQCAREVLGGQPAVGYYPPAGRNGEVIPMSYRKTKDHIRAHYTVELSQATFPQTDASLPGGSCKACPKRAGNNRAEYPDARADVCTDPACFALKTKAHQASVLADAEAKGQKVLTAKEAERAFPYGAHLAWNAPYVDLAEQCGEDRARKNPRSYKQLLEGYITDKDVTIATDGKGTLHRLVHKDTALPILREHHGLFKASAVSGTRTPLEDKKEKAKRMLANRIARAQEQAILGIVGDYAHDLAIRAGLPGATPSTRHAKKDADAVEALLRVLCRQALVCSWGESQDNLAAKLGVKGKTVADSRQGIEALIADSSASKLLALLVQLEACSIVYGGGRYSPDGLAAQLLAALGVDRKGIEQEVAADVKAEAKAKAKKKPARTAARVTKEEEE